MCQSILQEQDRLKESTSLHWPPSRFHLGSRQTILLQLQEERWTRHCIALLAALPSPEYSLKQRSLWRPNRQSLSSLKNLWLPQADDVHHRKPENFHK